MNQDTLLGREIGCDLVSGTAEYTARRGRITRIVSNAASSGIGDMTEEYPLSALNRKRVDTITLIGIRGTATVICQGLSKTATFATDLATSAANFVSSNAAAYLAVGVVLTSSGSKLIFKAVSNGVDFISETTITLLTTDLTGTVVTTYEKITGVVTGRSYMSIKRVDTVTLTGSSGTANVLCDGVTKLATWNAAGLTATAADFVTSHAADYLTGGVVVTSSGANLIFTSTVAGVNFTGSTTITNASGNLAGTVVATTANSTVLINDAKEVICDYPLTKFTPAAGSFWVYYSL